MKPQLATSSLFNATQSDAIFNWLALAIAEDREGDAEVPDYKNMEPSDIVNEAGSETELALETLSELFHSSKEEVAIQFIRRL